MKTLFGEKLTRDRANSESPGALRTASGIRHKRLAAGFCSFEKENHLAGGIVQRRLGEGAIFRDRLESSEKEERFEMRIGVIREPERFQFLPHKLVTLIGSENECEVENLVDLVHGILSEIASNNRI